MAITKRTTGRRVAAKAKKVAGKLKTQRIDKTGEGVPGLEIISARRVPWVRGQHQ